jgi:hypothetical protein
MDEEIKSNLKNTDSWKRLLYMLLFVITYNVAEVVVAVVVLLQIILTLFTGKRNPRVLDFGAQLSTYIYQVLQYLTYNSDEPPFPFADWPTSVPPKLPGSGRSRGGPARKKRSTPKADEA